jgi:dTDP-4-amino-4,6-dideoxygalactose transaminase
MRVAALDLTPQHEPLEAEILAAMARVLKSQRFILGPEVTAFEEQLAHALNCVDCVGVSSGSDALVVALRALGIGPGDEVITTTYTYYATAEAVLRVGATPVLVDIDPQTMLIDIEQVVAAKTARTKAVIVVHLFGRCVDVAALRQALGSASERAGDSREIPIIEDAAQAIGARHRSGFAGALGTLGCFSFFPTKNLGALGDGGAVTLGNESPIEGAAIRALRHHGVRAGTKYVFENVCGNFRLDALQAAILRVKLPHLAGWTKKREQNAARYRELFARAELPLVMPPVADEGCRDVYNQFVVRCERRDELAAFLKERAIATAVYYPLALHQQPALSQLKKRPARLPVAEAAAKESLALPIYPGLSSDQIEHVVEQIAAFFRG